MKKLAVLTGCLPALVVFLAFAVPRAAAEIFVQDNFDGAAGAVTSSPLEVDLNRNGWASASGGTALWLSGDGRLVSPDQTAERLAVARLLPTSPFAVITMTATIEMPVGDANWIGFGLADGVHSLAADQSGPWVKVHGTGLIKLYGGSGTNSANTHTVSYGGGPVEVVLTYNAHSDTMSLTFGGAAVFTDVPVAHTPGAVPTDHAVVEFSPNAGLPAAFSVDDFSVDVIPRPRPILTLPVTDTLFVSAYGAIANDALDDSAGIQSALTAAKTLAQTPGKSVELRFEPGRYIIDSRISEASGGPPPGSGCAVLLSGATNVWVNGNGAEILVTNPTLGFLRLFRCTNCIVQGFTVDYDPLPWTEGDVVSVNSTSGTGNNNVVIDLRAGFPDPITSPGFAAAPTRWGVVIDRNHPGRLRDNSHSSYDTGTVTQVAGFPARFRIPLNVSNGTAATIQPGDLWVQQARYNGGLFNPVECSQVTFLGITNYAGVAANFPGSYNQLLGVVNCQVRIKAGRSKSTDADGVLQNRNRIAPWIEGCTFEGLMDDLANFQNLPYVILETNVGGDPKAYKVALFTGTSTAKFATVDFSVGDQLRCMNPADGTVFGGATVVSVNTTTQVLVLSATIPGIVTPAPPGNGTPPQTGLSQSSTFLYNESLSSSGVLVNNQFLNSRRFGVYVKASHSLIADNTFAGLSASAIKVSNELGGFVGGLFPSNLLIVRNGFSECGNDFNAVTTASITAGPVYPSISLHKIKNNGGTVGDNYVTTGREFTGIRILGNTFDLWRRAAVRLMNCVGVEIIGNTFAQPKTDFPAPSPGNRIVDLHYSDNILIANNRDVQPGVTPLLQTNCTGVTTNNAFDGAPPTFSPVSIASNNANAAWAKLGDIVAVSFTASEPIQTPMVTLLGVAATVANPSGNAWTASVTVGAGTAEGTAAFSITATDLAGNIGAPVTATTDASSVVVDKTGPTGGTMTLSPVSPFDPGTALSVTFADWTDPRSPLSYAVLIDGFVVSAQGTDASRNTTSPATPGAHTLKGRIYDALNNVTELTQSFTVNTPLESWRQQNFGTTLNTGNAADTADPDGDLFNNLLEFAFGTDPTVAQSGATMVSGATIVQRGTPTVWLQNTQYGVDYRALFGRRRDYLAAGLTYTVQFSADMSDGSWENSAATPTVIASDALIDAVTVPYPFFLSTGRKAQFFRVMVTGP